MGINPHTVSDTVCDVQSTLLACGDPFDVQYVNADRNLPEDHLSLSRRILDRQWYRFSRVRRNRRESLRRLEAWAPMFR